MKQKEEAKEEVKEVATEETKVIKVDFGKVSVQITFEGDPAIIDFREFLGNKMRAATDDIRTMDFCRLIYYSDGEIEVPEKYIQLILSVIKREYNVDARIAFMTLLLGITREEAEARIREEQEKKQIINQ